MKTTTYYQHLPIIFSIIVIVSCVCAVKQASAQAEPAATAIDEIKSLKIGDKVPDELWNRYFPVVSAGNDQTQMLKLGDYKDKLIILDFWATWCAPCISSLYKLDTLQKEFKDDLMIIPTSYEPEEKVRSFFADKGWQLPTAFEETLLRKYFPYRSIPHQVWIRDGKVMSIATSEYATAENITAVLTGQTAVMDDKIEVEFNSSKPLFHNGNGGDGSNMLYQSVISKRMNAKIGGFARPMPNQILAYNRSIEQLYRIALGDSIPQLISSRYLLFEVDDSTFYKIDYQHVLSKDKAAQKEWADKNLYCYNLVLPPGHTRNEVNKRMLQDLNSFFASYLGIKVRYTEKMLNSLALIRTQNYIDIASKGGETMRKRDVDKAILKNQPLSAIINWLNISNKELPIPITDETGINYKIDLTINANMGDLPALKKELNRYGLDLVEKVAPVKMIVFSSENNDKLNN